MDFSTLTLLFLGSFVLVFAINVAPALMPPTWAVLAGLHFWLDLPWLPLAIGGAVAASAGRLALALLSRRYGSRLLTVRRREDLCSLGLWLEAKARWAAPLAVLLYSFGPIPSNQLFVGAGLAGMRLAPIVGAFLAGRLVSYPLWILITKAAATRFDQLFVGHLTNLPGILTELLAIGLLVVFVRLDWSRVIRRIDPSWSAHAAHAALIR